MAAIPSYPSHPITSKFVPPFPYATPGVTNQPNQPADRRVGLILRRRASPEHRPTDKATPIRLIRKAERSGFDCVGWLVGCVSLATSHQSITPHTELQDRTDGGTGLPGSFWKSYKFIVRRICMAGCEITLIRLSCSLTTRTRCRPHGFRGRDWW